MKLHLPKKLSIAIVAAFASLSAQSAEFSGTIYTWNGDMYNRDDIAYGQFYVTTYDGDTATVHTDQTLEPNSSSDWSPISAVFCRSGYTGTLATMRFDGSYGTSRPTARLNFSPFNVAGIIVEEGAVGYSVVSNRESRPVNIGNMNGEASYSLIKEDFTLAHGEITIYGPNTFNVATNKTFRLTTGVSLAGDLTITGGGMVEYAQGDMTLGANSSIIVDAESSMRCAASIKMGATSSIVVNTGSSMSCSSGLMMTSSATISNNGTLELDGTIKLGGAGIENNGSVMLGSNVVFDLSQLTAQDNSYKLFSGTSQVDLSQYDYTIDNIAGIPFKEGYAWTFGSNGTISYHALDVYEWSGSEHEWVAGGTGWTRNGETVTYPTMDEVHALFPKAASPECVMSVDVHGTVTASILEIGDSYTFNLTDSASVTPRHIQIGKAGTEVNFTGSGEVRAGAVYASGSTISLAKGVVMRVNDVSVGGAELTGDGTFVLPYGESGMHGFALGNDWEGTVRIGGFSSNRDTRLNSFANGSLSTVEICGITGGYLPEYEGGTVGVDIKLTNPGSNTPAWIWDNGSGYSNYTITFTGDWSGSGTFQKTANYNQSFTFTGNISEWRGAFEFTTDSGRTTNLTFQGNATEVNAAISKPGSGTLNVVVGDGENSFSTVFNNGLTASSLEISNNASAILKGGTELENIRTFGNASLTNEGNLTLQGVINVSNSICNDREGIVTLNDAIIFDLSNMQARQDGSSFTYAIFSGTSQVDLSQYDYTIDNIAGIPFKEGYAWTFGSNGTISYHALDVYEWTGSEHEWVAGGTGWTRNGETVTYPTMDEVHALFPKVASPECVMSVDVYGTVTASLLEIRDSYTFNLTDSSSVTPRHIQIGKAGTEVNFTGSGEVRAGAVYASGSTISLAKGVVMRVNDVSVGGAELTGDGTFVLPYGESGMHGFALGNDWEGTVRIGGFSASNSTHLDNFANGSLSTVEICGITGGYLPEYEGGTVGVDIKLTNPGSNTPAWIWDNGSGYSNYTITFTGDWSGSGTFQKTANYNQSFTFTGNISEWSGAFEFTTGSGRTTNLTFQGNAEEVNAAISKPGSGTLNLIVGDGQSDFDATFGNNVTASSLQIKDNATATLKGETSIGMVSGAGALIVDAAGYTVSINGSSGSLAETIDLRAGTLVLNGTYDVTPMPYVGTASSYVGGEGIGEHSGFAKIDGYVQVVSVGTDATLNIAQGTVFNYRDMDLAMNAEDGRAMFSGVVEYNTLYVRGGDTASYAAAWGIARQQEPAIGLASVVLENGTTINMDKEGASTGLIINGDAIVNATEATTITSVDGWNNTLTISGEGAVTLLNQNITMSGTAALDVQGNVTTRKIRLNSDDARLTVEAEGVLTTDNSNLTLTRGEADICGTVNVGHELDLSDGGRSTGKLTLHTGAEVAVANVLWMSNTSEGILLEEGATLAITGSHAKFIGMGGGGITTTASNDSYETRSGYFTITNAVITALADIRIGNMLVECDVVTGAHAVTLSNAASTYGDITVNEGGRLIASADLNISGTLKIAEDGGMQASNVKVNVRSLDGGGVQIKAGTNISETEMHGASGKGSLENVSMETSANYTIENMSISGSLIDVGEGTTLYLVNVDIHSDTHITDEAAWLDMQATNAWLDENNAHVMGRHVSTEDTTLYLSGDPSQAITMAAGRVVVELTSDMFDTVTMTGGEPGVDLWLDMTAIADAFEGADYVALDFRNLAREFSNAMVNVEELQVNVTLDGETYKQAYAMTDHGTTTTLYFAVPEPTTSTLSLLALSALAARRRRTL